MEQDSPQTPPRKIVSVLNATIAALILLLGVLSYTVFHKPPPPPAPPPKPLQLDVQNGCGTKGAAARFTSFLRANGYDVVEMKNYKTSHISHTLVIDRIGDLSSARRVASSLGVPESYIIQQINPDYFVDVSVIVGEDYADLRPSRQ